MQSALKTGSLSFLSSFPSIFLPYIAFPERQLCLLSPQTLRYRVSLILQDAFFLLPSAAVAVTVTVCPMPAFFAFTTPLLLTVAYFVLLDFHVTFLFVA